MTYWLIFLGLAAWTYLGLLALRGYEDCSIVFVNKGNDSPFPYFNPLWWHKHYKVNFIGVFFLTLIFNLVCPLLSIAYWLVKLIKWICTVGRK